jgi:drug/metabolite transporter (DMT)-like permease
MGSFPLLKNVPTTLPEVKSADLVERTFAALSLASATIVMFYAIRLLGSFQYSLMVKAEPVFTALLSALLAGEILTVSQYLGMALVIVSLIGYQWMQTLHAGQSS